MLIHAPGGSLLPVRTLLLILTALALLATEAVPTRAQDGGDPLDDDDVEVITIQGEFLKGGEKEVQLERQDEVKQTEAISNTQMSKLNVSDAGGAVKKLPAVTLKGGDYAYIRGLGERYSQTLFNGSSIPSPEPDKRVVPLSLFPASLLEKIVITKTYSPDTPGEFSGGSVQIHSRGIPEEPFFKVGLGLKYSEEATMKDFQTYEGGNYDALTFNDNTRKLPDEIPSNTVREGARFSSEDIQRFGRSFNNIWNAETMTAPPAHKLDLSFGDRYELGEQGELGQIGLLGAVNWSNTYSVIRDEKFRILKNEGSVENPDPRLFSDFSLDTYKFTSELSAMLNLTYEMSETQKVGVRNFYTRAMDDRVRFQSGVDGNQQRPIRVTNLRNIERSLFSTQVHGDHLLVGDIYVAWRTSYSLSQRDEPDRRSVRYDLHDGESTFELENVSDSGSRDFYQLDENIFDGGLDIAIPLPWKDLEESDDLEPDEKFKFGGAYVVRDRDFDSRRFRYIPTSIAGEPRDEDGNVIDQTADPEDIFRAKNLNPDGFLLTEVTRTTDNYEAEQLILAGYGLIELDLVEDLRLQAGVRYEKSVQEVTTFELFGNPPEVVEAKLDDGDFLPAVNLTYSFLPEHKLRLGGSRTVSRPEFRELAEFQFTDVASGFIAKGNPDLERATIVNADLRYEWFPAPGELFSASIFYKRFDSPIEKVIIPTGSSLLTSWDNADTADLYGFEIEVRKSLGFLNRWFVLGPSEDESWLDDLSLIANFALIESEVSISEDEDSLGNQTNNKRPLEGQPEYVLNVGMLYDNRDLGLTVALFASTFGESISGVGAFGLPDEKEQPRWSLDFNISKTVGRGSIKLSAENLLDDAYTFEQGEFTTVEYRKGIFVGLSYSVNF